MEGKQEEDEKVYKTGTRIFLSEVDRTLGVEKLTVELKKVFQAYGDVREVFVPTRSTKAYAFVRFNLPEETRNALRITTPHNLFKIIEPARDINPRNKKRAERTKKAQSELAEKESLLKRSNVVCQVHKSHFERLCNFLEKYAEAGEFKVSGTIPRANSRSISFVFVFAEKRQEFCTWLNSFWFLKRSLHRTFLVDNTLTPTSSGSSGVGVVASRILEALSKLGNGASVRLCVFPPRLCQPLLNSLEDQRDDFKKKVAANFSPTNVTHILGVIQLLEPAPLDVHDGLYCFGIWESNALDVATVLSSRTNTSTRHKKGDVCRAYWKLEEAFDRYDYPLPSKPKKSLDCGAAPGGWTLFLDRKLQSQTIYSIDPGELDETVLKLPSVNHWRKTIQKSLPKLQQEKSRIDVWVSDMCVKDMEQQVDWLLKAFEMTVIGQGTFFVLTLKCILGHSSQTFDILVEQQLQRLKPLARNLQMVHLFYNRFSERTVLGYIK